MADDTNMELHTYLKQHEVEPNIAAAVKRVLHERPANPLVAISRILLKSATKAELEELRQFIDELDLAITDKTTKERWDELKGLAKLPPEDLTPYAELIAQGLAYEGPSGSNDWMVREEALKLLDKLSNDAVLQHADAFATSLFETTKSNKRDTAVAAKLDRLAPDLAKQVPEVVRHQSHEKELARQVACSVRQHIEPEVLARRISSSNSSDGDSIFLSLSRDASHAELLGQVVKIDPSIAERTVQNGERKGERYADVGMKECKDAIRVAIGDKARLDSEARRRELEALADLSPEELKSHAELIAQGLAYEGPSGSNDWMVREEALKLLDKLSNDAVLQHADAFATSLFETTKSNKRDTAVAAKLDRLAPDLAKQVPEVVRHQSHEKELARQVACSVRQHIEPEVLARRISSSNSSDGDSIFLSLSRDASHAELLGQVVKIDPSIAERTVQNGEHEGECYADVGIQKCNEAIRAALYSELLIFSCSPTGPKLVPLPDAEKEAEEVKSLFPAGAVELKLEGTADDLRQMLQKKPVRRFLFAGHGNAPSPGDHATGTVTLGFTRKNGELESELESISHDDVARMLGLASTRHDGKKLELVVLNGCETEDLGKATCQAGVQTVVCWSTEVIDEPARVFARSFFEAIAKDNTAKEAFEQAKLAVTSITRPGSIAGIEGHVSKYELRGRYTVSPSTDVKPKPLAAGVPILIES